MYPFDARDSKPLKRLEMMQMPTYRQGLCIPFNSAGEHPPVGQRCRDINFERAAVASLAFPAAPLEAAG
jgi:hypothetical protein